MPEETVVLAVRLTKSDLDQLAVEADKVGLDVSVFARKILAETTPGLTGQVNKQGGARKGAGRKPKSHDARTDPIAV